MPEALAIFLVLNIAVGGILFARFLPDPEKKNRALELQRRRQHAAWLRERVATAEREKWGGAMIGSLRKQLAGEEAQMAALEADPPRRVS